MNKLPSIVFLKNSKSLHVLYKSDTFKPHFDVRKNPTLKWSKVMKIQQITNELKGIELKYVLKDNDFWSRNEKIYYYQVFYLHFK